MASPELALYIYIYICNASQLRTAGNSQFKPALHNYYILHKSHQRNVNIIESFLSGGFPAMEHLPCPPEVEQISFFFLQYFGHLTMVFKILLTFEVCYMTHSAAFVLAALTGSLFKVLYEYFCCIIWFNHANCILLCYL